MFPYCVTGYFDCEVYSRWNSKTERFRYATKIKLSGAQAVLTGNFGNDLTLLVKAARDVGFDGKFYTFYGNALGVPGVLGEAGVGKVLAVADWLPNV